MCVMLSQIVQQLQRHLFFVEGIASDSATGRQVVATFCNDDPWPEHTRCVIQIEIVGNRDALFQFRHPGLIAGFCRALALERVDQCGFSNIRNAANQHPHGLGHATAVGRQRVARSHQRPRRGGNTGIQCNGAHPGHGVVMGKPLLGPHRVGKILFVEHHEPGLCSRHFSQHGVGTGPRQAGIQQLDNNVNVLDALRNRLACQMHVTGKPLNCHTREETRLLPSAPLSGSLDKSGT